MISKVKIKTTQAWLRVVFLLVWGLLVCCQDRTELDDPLQAGWKGEKVCELIQETDELRVLKCTFEPGVGHERHYHAPHMAYTLAGSTFQLTDTTGVRTLEVPTGYSYYSEGVEWHEALNVGDSTGVFLIIEPKG